MNVCDEILQRRPTVAFFWISTKAPILVSSPIVHPYRFTSDGWKMLTLLPRLTLSAMGMARLCRSVPTGHQQFRRAAECRSGSAYPPGQQLDRRPPAPCTNDIAQNIQRSPSFDEWRNITHPRSSCT